MFELDIRKKTGVTIVAIVREGNPISNPSADFKIKKGDELIAMGTKTQLENLENIAIEKNY